MRTRSHASRRTIAAAARRRGSGGPPPSPPPENPDLTAFNTASINFGPDNVGLRTYTGPATFTLPDANWCMAIQFNTAMMTEYVTTPVWLCGLTGINSGSSGNDWGIGFFTSDNQSGTKGAMRFVFRRGGVLLTTEGNFTSSANVLSNDNKTYWAFAQRNGASVEYYLCEAGGVPVLLGTGTYNATYGSRSYTTNSFGINHRGGIGTWFIANQILTVQNIQDIASGVNPDTIVPAPQRNILFHFSVTAGSSINAHWGTGTLTPAGDWVNRPSGSALQVRPVEGQIRLNYLKNYRVFPRKLLEAKSYPILRGTYHNYTPTAIQYRVLNGDLTVAKNWTALTSFSATGGSWSGGAELDEGGPYYIQVRDANYPTVQHLSDTPQWVAPTIVSTGQSPMARFDGANIGADTLTGSLILGYTDPDVRGPILGVTANTPAGLARMANQFSADTGNKTMCYIPRAVGGTAAQDWAGRAIFTLATSGTYTVDETVEIRTSGNAFIGTAKVVESSGTSLTVKYLDATPAATNLVVGLTSGVSRTINASTNTEALIPTCFPSMRTTIEACDVFDGDVVFYWLNGSSDAGTSEAEWSIAFGQFWDRVNEFCATRNITPHMIMVPHNRQTGGVNNGRIRRIQRNWAVNHPQFGSRVFLGWHFHDMPIVGELAGTAQAGTSTSITLPADYDGTNAEPVQNITIVAGTGAGQTRTGTTYNATTKVQTVTPAWTTIPDATSQFEGWTAGPHQGLAGYRRQGFRFGRSIAHQFGYTPTTDQPAQITSVTRNASGTVLTVNITHTAGTALETPNGGSNASNVYGFEVSENDFANTLAITSVQITSATQVTITLTSAPSNPANLQVRYLWEEPVPGADFMRLGDILYDNQDIDSGLGQPVQPTWAPLTTTLL